MNLESDLTTEAFNETGTLTDQQNLQNSDEQSEKLAMSKLSRLKSPRRTLAWDVSLSDIRIFSGCLEGKLIFQCFVLFVCLVFK